MLTNSSNFKHLKALKHTQETIRPRSGVCRSEVGTDDSRQRKLNFIKNENEGDLFVCCFFCFCFFSLNNKHRYTRLYYSFCSTVRPHHTVMSFKFSSCKRCHVDSRWTTLSVVRGGPIKSWIYPIIRCCFGRQKWGQQIMNCSSVADPVPRRMVQQQNL